MGKLDGKNCKQLLYYGVPYSKWVKMSLAEQQKIATDVLKKQIERVKDENRLPTT
jgi:hypothetical protein